MRKLARPERKVSERLKLFGPIILRCGEAWTPWRIGNDPGFGGHFHGGIGFERIVDLFWRRLNCGVRKAGMDLWGDEGF